mmetsp:Transcript_1708/g.5102  ORF Transcript_1708/g.5102 Transcript_1708/m.5102 type:complete len:120 (-) Transcript_1708:1089-1448(-)
MAPRGPTRREEWRREKRRGAASERGERGALGRRKEGRTKEWMHIERQRNQRGASTPAASGLSILAKKKKKKTLREVFNGRRRSFVRSYKNYAEVLFRMGRAIMSHMGVKMPSSPAVAAE